MPSVIRISLNACNIVHSVTHTSIAYDIRRWITGNINSSARKVFISFWPSAYGSICMICDRIAGGRNSMNDENVLNTITKPIRRPAMCTNYVSRKLVWPFVCGLKRALIYCYRSCLRPVRRQAHDWQTRTIHSHLCWVNECDPNSKLFRSVITTINSDVALVIIETWNRERAYHLCKLVDDTAGLLSIQRLISNTESSSPETAPYSPSTVCAPRIWAGRLGWCECTCYSRVYSDRTAPAQRWSGTLSDWAEAKRRNQKWMDQCRRPHQFVVLPTLLVQEHNGAHLDESAQCDLHK